MGDGGVACVASQHIMERFPICGGNTNGSSSTTTNTNNSNSNSNTNTTSNSNTNTTSNSKLSSSGKNGKIMKKVKRIIRRRKEPGLKNSVNNVKEVLVNSSNTTDGDVNKDEVEEGELGTLPIENGEFIAERATATATTTTTTTPRKHELKSEIEKGEVVGEKWRNDSGKVEKDQFNFSGKWRKPESAEKTGYNSGHWKVSSKEELDKGEYFPERRRKSEVVKDDYVYSRARRHDSVKDNGWNGDGGCTEAPSQHSQSSSGKYSNVKELSRSGNNNFSRYDGNVLDKSPRISSKIVDDVWTESSDGKIHSREYNSVNRFKRQASAADTSDWNHRCDSDDYMSSKLRKVSDKGVRTVHSSEHYTGHSTERSHRNVSFSSKNVSFSSKNVYSDKYSSRHVKSSSKATYDKGSSSPRHSGRPTRDRAHHYDQRDRSPVHYDPSSRYDFSKSPNERNHGYGYSRSPHGRSHPYSRSRSPYDRSRHVDNRKGSPSSAWSPQNQSGYHDCRVQTQSFLEQSPVHGRLQDTDRKSGGWEKKKISGGNRGSEGNPKQQKNQSEQDFRSSTEESEPRSKSDANHDSRTETDDAVVKEEIIPDSDANTSEKKPEAPRDSGSTEELASMEEDMDICNTPPHDPLLPDAIPANWFYLDHIGEEQGPSGLSDLKKLVEQGILMSDHLIKHSGSDRWVTVENAVSPLVTVSFPSIVSDTVTELVSPPEAPGNLLVDSEVSDSCHPMPLSLESTSYHEGCLASETLKDFYIEERVEALLEGLTVSPGRELEIVGEALQMTFVNVEWEKWGITEADFHDQICSEAASESVSEETKEVKSTLLLPFEKDIALDHASDEWFSGLWSCKGGDWKRNDEDLLDRPWKRKVVLNDGYPLCQMEKCLYEDPRLQQKDELYYTSHGQKFDLPGWAFTSPDEWNDSGGASRSALSKIHNIRGVCGMMLPVVRINACVIKDHESFGSEQRVKARVKDIYSSRSSRNYSVSSDRKRSSEESYPHPKGTYEQDSRDSWKSCISTSFSVPKDHICTVDELNLHLGDWYYFDGAGHERGPLSFSDFQALAEQGAIPKNSSIYRKVDKIWVPVFSAAEVSISGERTQQVRNDSAAEISGKSLSGLYENTLDERSYVSGAFHSLHPHFIGYTRGKLHELVMKSYKSREFAAAINEVLDPWINTRIPKKEMDRHISGSVLFQKSDQLRAGKRSGIDEIEESAMDDISGSTQGDWSFDKLCSDAIFRQELGAVSKTERGNWGQMDGCVLARVFHFLRADIRSLVNVALTCKLWRYIVSCYKDASRQVDLSSLATNCNDTIIWNIMNGYDREKVCSLIIRGCTSITFSMLEEVLKSFHNLAFVDIRGCNQFEELADRFPNVTWIRNRGTDLKIRSVKHLSDKQLDDSSGLRDYLENADRRDSAKQLFQQSLYKRSKLFDARKSSSILSRDANLSRFAMRKSNIAYKRMEDFLDLSIKDIMKENTFEFFVPKVAKIEDRMRSGYYAKRGLSSVKEDIMQMCRDAIKKKNRSDVSGINRIVTLFFRLATYLEGGSKSAFDRDEIMKTWKDDSPPGFPSVSSKYKKNYSKANDKKSIIRNNGSSFINSISDYGDYISDREIRTCLSKLHKKLVDSGSETSDDVDRSSDEGMTDSEITDSNTASDSDLRSEGGTGESRLDAYSPDEGFDSFTYEREWGARMTKASLVPPVARKYEVIDHYVVVADEEEVRRKMRVSLPEDYAEKLTAQRSGNDESDMQIPEVKDYKPRKCLGVEVIEQEVYGIDPYTHNLLLDSLPEELEWSPQDMHVFIENVLLRTLNKQVRHFTGSGSTPMTYPLKSVFEEILETAEENNDCRTLKLSKCILKAIDSRPEDNYVAYRKGLGVVCNKEGGFSEDDFVVEFLGEVYPAWKWFEKQDGIRSLQKNSKDPAPEFYNIYLERPKGDADGYDLVVVDAMHKANYASRICHSCRPNSEAKVTAVDGQYQIGIYSVRPIQYGEEITFDYNSVTESKEEYEASVCLCGSHVCRGSFLNLTGEGAYLKVLKEYHGILDRQRLILEACELNSFSDEDYIDLLKAGLGKCLLDGLPDWLVAYSARLVRFINFERLELPKEILKHNLEEKKKYFADISLEVEKSDAEVQAEGVYNQRLQNLALTLDKVRYVMRCVFGDPKKAPPPLERLSPQEAASYIWSGEGSLVDELVQCMTPHMENSMLRELQAQIRAHDPSGANNIETELQKSLIWLRDEVRNLPCSYKCRNDAAADLIHVYAYTKSYFRIREYKPVTSPPVYISSLDLCPKYADKLGSDCHEYCKTYGENYCLGQLVYWYNQANADPDGNLARASRGCLSLPDIGSFYAQVQKPSRQRVYGPRTVKFMLSRMEKQSQRAWPKDRIWTFKTNPKIVGSPMLDAVLNKAPLDKEMLHWLKHRIPIYQAQWDR